jgi:SAM-dependent methyltransferase
VAARAGVWCHIEMESYGPATYGDRIADVYDEMYAARDPEATVARIAELAGPGPVLELGIGTGRVAVPLAATGVDVHGIDASEAMVAQLRARSGGASIPVAMGDMRDVAAPANNYSLVFVAFNTFFGGLLDQEAQVECFANVARRLAPGGRFVIEGFVPDLARFDRGQRTSATSVAIDSVDLDVMMHDSVAQRVHGHHVVIRESGTRLFPVAIRYAFPSELDLMARLAGLELESREGGYAKEPFTAASGMHVSVWQKPNA